MRQRTAAAVCAAAFLAWPALLAAQTPAPPTPDPRDLNLVAYAELLRADVRAQKVAFLTQLMELTEAEDAAFWPIYREYDTALTTLNDERLANLRRYADAWGAVTDELAEALARKSIDIDRRRTALLERTYDRVKGALSATLATRFLQIEHQLLLVIDLQIAASLPVVK